MQNLHVIIFCLNRPILCDNLLRSIADYFRGENRPAKVTLLYGATDASYEQGFSILMNRFLDSNIDFVRKAKGKWRIPLRLLLRPRNLYYYLRFPYYRTTASIFDFKPLLENIIEQSACEYVTFLTDDSFFYRDVNVSKALACLSNKNASQSSFSFRHGLNMGRPPAHLKRGEDFIDWNFGNPESDGYWSYRFSIDGHIYRRSFLLPFIRPILYVNPNTFEGVVARFAELKGVLSCGHGFCKSVLVGAEINRVQSVSNNNNLGVNNEMLNEHYLKGFCLEIIVDEPITRFHPHIRKLSLRKVGSGEHLSLLDNITGTESRILP